MELTEVIAMLILPFYVAAQRYMLESPPSYLNGVKVCPVTVNITCRADRVLVLRWIAEHNNGTVVEFASHSGNVNDVYQRNRPDWTSIQYAQPAIIAYANSEFDINATISIPLSYMIDESISSIFCGSSETSRSESFIANATIIGPPPPPQFNRCCTRRPMDPMGFITCNHTSPNETSVNFPHLPNVDKYTVNYDEHLVSTDCLHNQFVSPNMRCKFMQQNESTEYSFSIRAINCNNQESQSSNFTLITVVEGILNISYVAKYQGIGGELMETEVQWIDEFEMACKVTTTYIVQLESSNGITLNITLSTQDCTNKLCSVQFTSNLDKTAESYTVIVTASNSLFNDTFTSDTIMSTTGNFINYDMCNNSASVTCSTFSSENCSMNSMDIGSPVLIKPGDTYLVTLDTNPQNIEITIRSNSTILVQSLNFTVGNTGDAGSKAILGVGVAVFIFGFIIVILGYGVGIVVCCKHKKKKYASAMTEENKREKRRDYWYMWMVTLVFSITAMVIFIVTLILWSLVSASSSSASCLNKETYPPILTAAVALSFIFILLGVIMLGGFVIAFELKWKCLTQKDTKEQFIVYNVEFGKKAPKVRQRNTQGCSICHQQYAKCYINEEGNRTFEHKFPSEKEFICSTCNESVCDKCSKMVYVKHCKQEKKVCDSCYKVYQDEQNKLSGIQFGKHKPPKSPCSEECYECGETDGQNINTAKDPLCCTCGHYVCDECFDEHEVEVDYLHKEMKVCKNCYAIYKMTLEDVNKEKKQQSHQGRHSGKYRNCYYNESIL